MRALAPALCLALLSCTPSFPLPPGAQLECTSNDECPAELLCDPELSRCVSSIVLAPKLTLTVDPTEGSRADVFTFTSSSPDPSLRYRWELLDDSTGDAGVLVADGSPTLQHRFTLARAEFCPPNQACKSALARTVRVIATNEGGKKAERQISVVIKNVAPIADFGEDLFISELGVPEVELDLCGGVRVDGGCTSRDPDGDPLEFSGFAEVVDSGLVLRDAGPGRVRFTPPASWQRPLVFEGEVSDGIESARGTVRVFRGSHAWVNAGQLDQTWRIHPDFRTATTWTRQDAGIKFYSPEALVSDGVGGWWFGDSDDVPQSTGPTLVVHLDRNLNELERWEVPNGSTAADEALPSLVPPRGSTPGCLVYRHYTGRDADSQSGFVRFTTGPSQTTIKHSRPPLPDGGTRVPLAVLPVGGQSDCWAIGQGPNGITGVTSVGGELGKLQADGSWVPVAMLAGFPQAWTAEADGTLWIAERFPLPSPDGGALPPALTRFRTELRRFTPAGASSTVDLPGRFVVQIAAHPRGGLWAVDGPARSLVRVWPDGTVTAASTPPVGHTSVFGFTGLTVDPVGAAVWVTDSLADQLYRFDEEADGGLVTAGLARAEDLPAGVNRKGFTGRIAVSPISGEASTFVGAVASLYAQWVTVPLHARRLERSGVRPIDPIGVRGDPSSGHAWGSSFGVLRRFDVQGRTLVEVPNTWGDGPFPSGSPLIVDRSGTAWVINTDGAPALRAIDTDGSERARVALPFNVPSLALASSMQSNGPRQLACGVSRTGEVMRLDLATTSPQTLTVPTQADGGIVRPFLCAPMSSGRAWVLANQLNPGGAPQIALLYEAGATTPAAPIEVRTVQPGDQIQVTGASAEEGSGDLFLTTWRFPDYSSELLRVGSNGSVSVVRQLQGNGAIGIGLGVQPRRLCAALTPACLELWVPNRLKEVHRYDLQGTDLENFVFDRAEPTFDLVP